MAKIKRMRSLARASNISQPRGYTINAPPVERNAAAHRAQEQLRKFLDQAQYAEARELFSEMIKTAVYPIEDIWKVGLVVIYDLQSFFKLDAVGGCGDCEQNNAERLDRLPKGSLYWISRKIGISNKRKCRYLCAHFMCYMIGSNNV